MLLHKEQDAKAINSAKAINTLIIYNTITLDLICVFVSQFFFDNQNSMERAVSLLCIFLKGPLGLFHETTKCNNAFFKQITNETSENAKREIMLMRLDKGIIFF